jgi:hypothetical protein
MKYTYYKQESDIFGTIIWRKRIHQPMGVDFLKARYIEYYILKERKWCTSTIVEQSFPRVSVSNPYSEISEQDVFLLLL